MDPWKVVTPVLSLITLMAGMLFFYVKTTIKSAIDDLMKALEARFNTLDNKLGERIVALEKNDIRADGVSGAIADINARLTATSEYSHTLRHELSQRLQAHELILTQHASDTQALNTRVTKVEVIPDLIDAKLNVIIEQLRVIKSV